MFNITKVMYQNKILDTKNYSSLFALSSQGVFIIFKQMDEIFNDYRVYVEAFNSKIKADSSQ